MKKHIFVTGGLGFLGFNLVKCLLRDKECHLVLLAREKNGKSAEERVSELIKKDYRKNSADILKRITVIEGDVTDKNLFRDIGLRKDLTAKIHTIFHSAALCELDTPIDVINKINADGTHNVLNFALECMKKGTAKSINHISTAAVAGNTKGIFYEDQLEEKQGFNNTYEQSKYEAEKIAHGFRDKGLPVTIFRPSIIVGDSKTGWTNDFNMFYQPLHILSLGLFPRLPARKNAKHSLVPVDYAAEAIYFISGNEKCRAKTFHIANPNTITFERFIDIAGEYFGFEKPKMVPMEEFAFNELSALGKRLLNPYIAYFNYETSFDASNSLEILSKATFKWPEINEDILHILFDYCVKAKYIIPKNKNK